MFTIVFICTGNTCRSPMAEWIARKLIKEKGLEDSVQVLSGGVAAWDGAPITRGAQEALDRRQVQGHSGHEAKRVDMPLLEIADLVLTLAESHRAILLEKYPEYKFKIHNFLAYATGTLADVDDPYGGDGEVYEQTAKQIEAACAALLQRIAAKLGKA